MNYEDWLDGEAEKIDLHPQFGQPSIFHQGFALDQDKIDRLSPQELAVLKKQMEYQAYLDRLFAERRCEFYQPYPKQREFHAAGLHYRERWFRAGNQCLTANTVIQTDRGERRVGELLDGSGFGVRAWDG